MTPETRGKEPGREAGFFYVGIPPFLYCGFAVVMLESLKSFINTSSLSQGG